MYSQHVPPNTIAVHSPDNATTEIGRWTTHLKPYAVRSPLPAIEHVAPAVIDLQEKIG
jgi:hypothetical protein